MKGVSLALLGVLAALHWLEGHAATAQPLSMFRDADYAWLGYAAFALLILKGLIMAHAASLRGIHNVPVLCSRSRDQLGPCRAAHRGGFSHREGPDAATTGGEGTWTNKRNTNLD